MHRFFYPTTDFTENPIHLTTTKELHHLRNVLRLKANDAVTLFNGRGSEATGRLVEINTQQATIEIESVVHIKPKIPKTILACAIPKKGKFELIIEKATELGVDEIIPLKTTRTEIALKDERLKKKMERYQTVAINAAKQCQRATIPVIHETQTVAAAFTTLEKTTTIIMPSLVEKRQHFLKTLTAFKQPQAIAIFIGPEGDFTDEEYAFAQKHGAHPVSLGKTILKVETAAICSLSALALFFDKHS